jgi:hypothetical protein
MSPVTVKALGASRHRHRAVLVRQGAGRDQHSSLLGVARPFAGQPARAWRRLCDVCRLLAQPFPRGEGRESAYPLQRRGDGGHTRILLPLRHARCVYAGAVTEDGEHTARLVRRAHRSPSALSRRHRGLAGMGLSLRKAASLARVSGRHVDWPETAQTSRGARHALRAVRCERCWDLVRSSPDSRVPAPI